MFAYMRTLDSRLAQRKRRVSAGRTLAQRVSLRAYLRYHLHMRERQTPPAFPDYLRKAIELGGFQTPTDFARTAAVHPSVVSRWLNGEIRPTVPLLERVAPVLGARLSTLVRLAYPEIDDGIPLDEGSSLHPLAAELNRRLGSKSALSDMERDTLARLVDSVLAQYRGRPTPRQTAG